MSIEILDCLKRERDICVKTIITSQNRAFMWTPAFKRPSGHTPAYWSTCSLRFTAYIFDIGHPHYGQLAAVKTRYSLTSITWPYREVRAHWSWKANQLTTMCVRQLVNEHGLLQSNEVVYPLVDTTTFEVLIIEQRNSTFNFTESLLTVVVKKMRYFPHTHDSFSAIPRLESRIASFPVLLSRPFPVLKQPPRFWGKSKHRVKHVCADQRNSHFWDNEYSGVQRSLGFPW